MAAVLRQAVGLSSALMRRPAAVGVTSIRKYAGAPNLPEDHHRGKLIDDKADMADKIGHAVGYERFELLNEKEGVGDVFGMDIKTREKGVSYIPSIYKSRMIGCICDVKMDYVKWWALKEGEEQNCDCGYRFKMKYIDISRTARTFDPSSILKSAKGNYSS